LKVEPKVLYISWIIYFILDLFIHVGSGFVMLLLLWAIK